ncbi:MAG TPA: hypothetical protein VEY07_06780 [Thermoplasmata archaeon]|nr:hypothetical protein [Thermoplasmata archaeon]HYK93730.1 hypothetical protein [Thermoplasmata archaeon]
MRRNEREHERGEPPRRSNAAMPFTVAFLFVGLLLGAYTIVVPALLGAFLLWTGLSFISTRLNPFSIGFYLTTKPSWPAIGLVFLSAVLLLVAAYGYYVSGLAPLLPKF